MILIHASLNLVPGKANEDARDDEPSKSNDAPVTPKRGRKKKPKSSSSSNNSSSTNPKRQERYERMLIQVKEGQNVINLTELQLKHQDIGVRIAEKELEEIDARLSIVHLAKASMKSIKTPLKASLPVVMGSSTSTTIMKKEKLTNTGNTLFSYLNDLNLTDSYLAESKRPSVLLDDDSTPATSLDEKERPVTEEESIDDLSGEKSVQSTLNEDEEKPETLETKTDGVKYVLDGANIGYFHGRNTAMRSQRKFSSKGLSIALDYYNRHCVDPSHPQAIAFLPQRFVASRYQDNLADDVGLLHQLMKDQVLFLTPSRVDDDLFLIKFAELHKCHIVTNDNLDDHVQVAKDQSQMAAFTYVYTVKYMFVRNEFLPL